MIFFSSINESKEKNIKNVEENLHEIEKRLLRLEIHFKVLLVGAILLFALFSKDVLKVLLEFLIHGS